jgi:hypothetical protein
MKWVESTPGPASVEALGHYVRRTRRRPVRALRPRSIRRHVAVRGRDLHGFLRHNRRSDDDDLGLAGAAQRGGLRRARRLAYPFSRGVGDDPNTLYGHPLRTARLEQQLCRWLHGDNVQLHAALLLLVVYSGPPDDPMRELRRQCRRERTRWRCWLAVLRSRSARRLVMARAVCRALRRGAPV